MCVCVCVCVYKYVWLIYRYLPSSVEPKNKYRVRKKVYFVPYSKVESKEFNRKLDLKLKTFICNRAPSSQQTITNINPKL